MQVLLCYSPDCSLFICYKYFMTLKQQGGHTEGMVFTPRWETRKKKVKIIPRCFHRSDHILSAIYSCQFFHHRDRSHILEVTCATIT